MAKDGQLANVVDFYETHPISEKQILDKLAADGVDTAGLSAGGLSEDTLQNYDQDHFGGLQANDALAALAGLDADTHMLDVCCGLGGPARYYAHNFGCRVTGLDLTQPRLEGARRLTELTGQSDRIAFQYGNALEMPFDDASFDVVISQEAFCHIPSKDRLISECVRVLKPGGRMAFSDILATEATTRDTRERMANDMSQFELSTAAEYIARFEANGCTVDYVDDLGPLWREILVDRLAMYRGLKGQTIERFGVDHFEKWDRAYAFFVAQFATGELSGGRFLAKR